MNLQFSAAIFRSLTSSVEDALSFYADRFVYCSPASGQRTITNKTSLAHALLPFTNQDPENGVGIHTLRALEYSGDQHRGVVIWRWSAVHCQRLFGRPAQAGSLCTHGMSFHEYENGKIVRDVAYCDEVGALRQAGLPFQAQLLSHTPALDVRSASDQMITRH